MIASQAISWLKRGATIGNGPQGAWITLRDGTVSNLHASSLRALARMKILRRVEPRDRFYAVTHYTYKYPTEGSQLP